MPDLLSAFDAVDAVDDELAEAAVTVTVYFLVPATLFLSIALIVKVNESALVGFPVIFPVVALITRPSGKEPLLTDHLYGAVPFEAVRVPVYDLPTTPAGNVPLTVVFVTFRVNDFESLLPLMS